MESMFQQNDQCSTNSTFNINNIKKLLYSTIVLYYYTGTALQLT